MKIKEEKDVKSTRDAVNWNRVAIMRIDCRDGDRVALDYIKQHGKKPGAIKKAWAVRTHSGIEVGLLQSALGKKRNVRITQDLQ